MVRWILLCIFFYYTKVAISQEIKLYMPLEFQNAYNKQTRSFDGRPGINYWVNRASYNIEAEADPETKMLSGKVNIQYENNSPDSLNGIVIRLYQDMYKKGNLRDRTINNFDVTDGVQIKKIVINNQKIDLNNRAMISRFGTNLFLRLPEKLLPNTSVTINIGWSFKIPEKTLIRMGAIDKSSMFIAYWYPQVSVYDDIDGWDMFNYSSMQEFYTENSNYKVKITLPSGYFVWSTGELLNYNDVYAEKTIEKIQEAKISDKIIHIVDNPENGLRPKKGNVTWEFYANNVPDFAFALSNHYLWDASSVITDSATNKRVLVNTVYNKNDKEIFQYVTEYQRLSMLFFSNELPGIVFPYSQFTTFQGLESGGMEFPMMANNGAYKRRNSTQTKLANIELTAHEMAHTYFPFLTGINERKYTWMEEGWATFFGEQAANAISEKVGVETNYPTLYSYLNRFYRTEGRLFSVPLMTPSVLLREAGSHFHVAYYKPFFAYKILRDILGEDMFGKCLKEYIDTWQGKHPVPYDFFFTFNNVSGENLNWFWKPWFFEFGYPDLAIKSVSENNITIENIGALPVPVELKIIYNDNSLEIIKHSAKVWKDNPAEFDLSTEKSIVSAELIFNNYPDVNAENDRMQR